MALEIVLRATPTVLGEDGVGRCRAILDCKRGLLLGRGCGNLSGKAEFSVFSWRLLWQMQHVFRQFSPFEDFSWRLTS